MVCLHGTYQAMEVGVFLKKAVVLPLVLKRSQLEWLELRDIRLFRGLFDDLPALVVRKLGSVLFLV
jgi:hypothetical protein